MPLIIMLLASFVPALIAAFGKPDFKPFYISGFAQGTSYNITYYAAGELVTSDHISELFAVVDSSLSVYKDYSLISQFNNSTSGIEMDEHLQKVVQEALRISKSTGGAFDMTVQPLVQAWGFGVKPRTTLPDAATVQSLMKCVGTEKLSVEGKMLLKQYPCVKIDVNGIAQGYTVDVIAAGLESRGIFDYLVEVGGEIRIKGKKQPEGLAMSIGIEGPGKNDHFPVHKIIQPPEGAVTTSGHYRKYHKRGNKRISHLIDARTGYPVDNKTISVTVWAESAMVADGYDNALIAMGINEGVAFAEKERKLEAYFIYETSKGVVADTATSGFYRLISNHEQ